MKIIRKILYGLFVCILCVGCLCNVAHAEANVPFGEIGDYGNWITEANMSQYHNSITNDATEFQNNFQNNLKSTTYIPPEVKLGLMFMKAMYSIDAVLQMSLVKFTIIFLLVMYAFWIALEAYKMIRESNDYKSVLYTIFIKGINITCWIIILNYGPAKVFMLILNPIIDIGTYVSDFILNAVAKTYNVSIPDSCAAIHNYVNEHNTGKLLIDANSAANIMCLPSRISVFFYHAIGAAFDWVVYGLTHSATAVIVGLISIVLFIKCILKYAFMTLGIVADLFLTLMMLPFTAIAECVPDTKETNYPAKVFKGFFKMFNTLKISDVINKFIKATIYFICLAIIIAICAALLSNIISVTENSQYTVGSSMTTILAGCFVLYLANKADKLATQMGGSIDNKLGKQFQDDTKNLWGSAKATGAKIIKLWTKK